MWPVPFPPAMRVGDSDEEVYGLEDPDEVFDEWNVMDEGPMAA